MFTLDQIKAAHSQVKSGADFPKYIQDIGKLGVLKYEHFVADGHTTYKQMTCIYYDRTGSALLTENIPNL